MQLDCMAQKVKEVTSNKRGHLLPMDLGQVDHLTVQSWPGPRSAV